MCLFSLPSYKKFIADFPGVVRVIPDTILSLQTTRSWDFLHVNPHSGNEILSKSCWGFGSIIGIIDTGWLGRKNVSYACSYFSTIYLVLVLDSWCVGIWPESESFRDKGLGKIPSRWRGTCQEGEQFNRSNCNRLYFLFAYHYNCLFLSPYKKHHFLAKFSIFYCVLTLKYQKS